MMASSKLCRARAEISAAGFFVSIVEIGRRPAHRGLASLKRFMERRSARRRPNQFIGRARANVPACGASVWLAPLRPPEDGDKVRAETIAHHVAICRTVICLVFVLEKR